MVKQPEPPLVDSHFHIWRDDLPLIRAAWHKPPTNATRRAGARDCSMRTASRSA